MKKKFWRLALAALLALLLLPGAAWAAVGDTFDDGTLSYQLTSDNEAAVTGLLKALDANGVLTIPETVEYNGVTYTVTAIGNNAFYQSSYKSTIKTVIFPDTLTKIGNQAFLYCHSLTGELNLPEGLKEIGNGAFSGFYSIGNSYANPMNITAVKLPSTLETLGSQAFLYCDKLTEVTIPAKITTLKNETFQKCTSLQKVVLPEGLETIGNTVFRDCTSLQDINWPDSLRSIGMWAFCGCSSLTQVQLNENMQTLDQCAFQQCSSLSEVTLPDGLANFYANVFSETACVVKTSNISYYAAIRQQIEAGKKLEEQGKNNFYKDVQVKLLDAEGNEIEGVVFEENNYRYIVLDDNSVQLLGYTGDMPGGELTVPGQAQDSAGGKTYNVTAIGSSAFARCAEITKLVLPEGLERIEPRAFEYCSALTDVEFPAALQFIGNDAFYTCPLVQVDLSATALQTIDTSAFMNCKSLESVLLPDSLANIGERTFEYCENLQSINLPAGLQKMGKEVFWHCRNLQNLTFAADCQLAEIPNGAFRACDSLTKVVLPASVRKINGSAFENCAGLQSIELPEGLETISAAAFYKCPLTGVLELPEGLTGLGAWAFGDCTDLDCVIIQGRNLLNNVAEKAFDNVKLIYCYNQEMLNYLQSAAGEGTQVKMLYDLASVTITPIGDQLYTGAPICPEITLSAGEGEEKITFVKDVDYTLTYADNTEIGQASVTIAPTPDGQLYGEARMLTFTILEPTVETVTISFLPGEGSGIMSSVEVALGSQYTLPACGFNAPEGKEFAGWAYLGQIYQAGALIENLAVDITLTATWQDKPEEPTPPVIKEYWTITFALNGGTLNPVTQTPVKVEKGLSYILPGAVREGYKLQHWQIGADDDNTAAANSAYTFTADTTVYAIWQEDKKPEKPSGGGGSSHRPSRPQQPTAPTEPTKPMEPAKPNQPGADQRPVSEIFADLQPNAWYIEAITELYRRGIMQGNADGTFAPNDNVSRAMFAQLLYNNSGRPAGYGSKFADVAADSWYAPAIGWAQANGLVLGYTAERFAPDEGITREQLVVMLWRYAGQPQVEIELSFTDKEQVGDWAKAALCWAAAEGIVIGDSSGAFAPQNMATRAEAAQMLVRYLVLIEE